MYSQTLFPGPDLTCLQRSRAAEYNSQPCSMQFCNPAGRVLVKHAAKYIVEGGQLLTKLMRGFKKTFHAFGPEFLEMGGGIITKEGAAIDIEFIKLFPTLYAEGFKTPYKFAVDV